MSGPAADIGTPHIRPEGVPIADTVLLPGDPLRAQFVAETYLSDVRCFNRVRGMLGYTGTYEGRPLSVMGTGMGMPSIGIYSHELVHTFGATTLVRIGSCGALREDIGLREIVVAQGACTDSAYLDQFGLPGTYAPIASPRLLLRTARLAQERGVDVRIGNILSTDVFYHPDPSVNEAWARMGVLAVEMESAALYANAAAAGVEALGVFTVSDNIVTGDALDPADRETGFREMAELALALVHDTDTRTDERGGLQD